MSAAAMSLEERLENWGEAWRGMRKRSSLVGKGVWSKRRGYGNAYHWDYSNATDSRGVHIGVAPSYRRPTVNAEDAQVVNRAWQAMPSVFHAALLGGWYVKRWSETHCLRVAWEAAGEPTRNRRSDFDASIGMARALLVEQLGLPAVILRMRVAARVHEALGLDQSDNRSEDRLDTMEFAVA